MKLFTIAEREAEHNQPSFEDRSFPSSTPHNPSTYSQPQKHSHSAFEQQLPLFIHQSQLHPLYHQPSHISIERNPHEPQKQWVVTPPARSLTPRKKIFNRDSLTVKLKEAISQSFQPMPKQQQFKKQQQLVSGAALDIPHDHHQNQNKRVSLSLQQERSLNLSKERSSKLRRQSNYPVNYERQSDRQTTQKVLGEFILDERGEQGSKGVEEEPIIQSKVQPSLHPRNIQSLSLIPGLVERMQRNQSQIKELRVLLKELVEEQKERDRRIKNYIVSQQQRERQGGFEKDKTTVKTVSFRDDKVATSQELEVEHTQRLLQLIQQNRHLCRKVLQQRMRHSSSSNVETSKTYEQKINKLHQQRQLLQGNSNILNNLDISVIPHPQKSGNALNSRPAEVIRGDREGLKFLQPLSPAKRVIGQLPIAIRQIPRTKIY